MGYRTDGSSHRSGVLNEEKLAQKLQEDPSLARRVWPKCPDEYEVKHLGGTQNKADITINGQGISVKKKKQMDVGSFDWINSSAAFSEHRDSFPALAEVLANPVDDVETLRERLKMATHDDLEALDNSNLRNLIYKLIIKPNEKMVVSIVSTEEGGIYSCDFKQTALYKHFKDSTNFSFKPTTRDAATSRTVLFNGKDIGLRIRVVLNNGVTAFLGLSKANKSSRPVIKFQQDRVHKFVFESQGEWRSASL